MLDSSEIYVKTLLRTIVNTYKLCFEEMGYDLGETKNLPEYRNYLADKPIYFYGPDAAGVENADGYSPSGFVGGDPGDTGLSNGMISFICFHETSKNFGYRMPPRDLIGYDLGDAQGHKTYGYGLLVHPNGRYMDTLKNVWSQQELENIYKLTAKKKSQKIDTWAKKNNITLNQNQKDAIASACYNFGDGFLTNSGKVYSNTVSMIKKNPNDPNIKNAWSHMSDIQGKRFPGLIKRRQAEANWYFGIY